MIAWIDWPSSTFKGLKITDWADDFRRICRQRAYCNRSWLVVVLETDDQGQSESSPGKASLSPVCLTVPPVRPIGDTPNAVGLGPTRTAFVIAPSMGDLSEAKQRIKGLLPSHGLSLISGIPESRGVQSKTDSPEVRCPKAL